MLDAYIIEEIRKREEERRRREDEARPRLRIEIDPRQPKEPLPEKVDEHEDDVEEQRPRVIQIRLT